jgi:hypothetical protein
MELILSSIRKNNMRKPVYVGIKRKKLAEARPSASQLLYRMEDLE